MALVGVPELGVVSQQPTITVEVNRLEDDLQAAQKIAEQNAERIIELETEREILLAQIDILNTKIESLEMQTSESKRRGRPPKAKR